jgi:hypothetical protein
MSSAVTSRSTQRKPARVLSHDVGENVKELLTTIATGGMFKAGVNQQARN